MIHRRKFLQTGTGILASVPFARSLGGASAPAAPGTIDCQSHLFCPELVTLMEKRREHPIVYRKGGDRYVQMGDWHRRIMPQHSDVNAKLAAMDANGIRVTALSINDPGPEWFGKDGVEVARIANDYVAAIVKQHPQRFIGLCVLPLQDIAAAMAELDRCVGRLGMKGILLYTNLAGRYPDEPPYRPLIARAAESGVPILLHPAKPLTTDVVKDYEMTSSLGNMFDDTIALTRFIMSGILDQYPGLKLVCPHLGGTLPFMIGRIDHQVQVLKRGPRYLKRAPSEYLRHVFLDVVSPQPASIRFVVDMVGPDRLLYGSDHPWVDPKLILDSLRSLKLPTEQENKILYGNAAGLFGINVSV